MTLQDAGVAGRLAAARANRVAAALKQWREEAKIRRSLHVEIEAVLAATSDLATARAFRDACPVPGTTVNDYLPRLIETPEVGLCLMQLRFYAGDLDRAFVDLIAWEGEIDDRACLNSLLQRSAGAWGPFKPSRVRLTAATDSLEARLATEAGSVDVEVMAAPLRHVRSAGAIRRSNCALVPATMLNWWEAYLAAYADFLRDCPWLADSVGPEPIDRMERLVEDRTLWEILVEGRWAGVIAIEPREAFGLTGYVMVEQLVTREFAGHGVAAEAQIQAATLLVDHGDDVLFGTIDPLNAPSFKTAIRVGRRSIWQRIFVPLSVDSKPDRRDTST